MLAIIKINWQYPSFISGPPLPAILQNLRFERNKMPMLILVKYGLYFSSVRLELPQGARNRHEWVEGWRGYISGNLNKFKILPI